jgi:NADH-quinone oxidoreductase subunit M
MIAWTIYVTFGAALLLLFLPQALARWMALLTTVAGFAISLSEFFTVSNPAAFKTIIQLPWIKVLGFQYHLAADGISLTMCLVTGLTAVSAVLFSWDVEERPNEFFFWLLLVVGGSYGVFLSADLFLLFVFYELVIVPKYFLIAIWGSTNKEYGAMKLTLYSFFGGALALLGILAIYVAAGGTTLDLQQLAQFKFRPEFQAWVFPVLFLGFAVLAGMWPLHTWAPTGHVAAPTAGSMLLAGIVMKLGAYAALRVAMNLLPAGFLIWNKWIAVLAVVGIIYAAGVALRQRDLKFVIGYSSVSHMGFVLLGLATANTLGAGGAVLQMFSHGVIAALLFAVAGRMIYRRTHTRDLDALGGMNLRHLLPFAAFTFVIASAASMGIPGFSGFVAEITVLLGVWRAYPLAVLVTGAGMVLVAAFTLRALKKTFFSDVAVVASPAASEAMAAISPAEKWGAALLMFATLAAGVYPKFLLDRILPAVEAMHFLKP